MDLPAALVPVAADPGHAALFVDFDGTLAPIVPDPDEARPLPGVPAVLAHLAARYALVAVVSGRPVAFLTAVLGPLDGVHLAGLYGLEERGADGVTRGAPGVERWRAVVADVTARARASAPAGVGVEDKGLTVTLHWRTAPDRGPWAERFCAEAAAATGLVGQPGRMAVELRPPTAADKGTVVERLGAGHAAAACFGDDLGDLPAFAALGRLAAGGAAVARVAVADAESPPEVTAAADVVVEGPEAALGLLQALAGAA